MKIIIAIIFLISVLYLIFFRQKFFSAFQFVSNSSKVEKKAEFTEEDFERDYELKKQGLELLLGSLHEIVGHALIPFQIGGNVDMYYFPNGIPGTGFATMELIEPDGSGPKANKIGTYELLTFTKHKMPSNETMSDKTLPFNQIERRMCIIMTTIGFYSKDAVLNPGDTCEVPLGDKEPNVCIVLDEYKKDGVHFEINGKRHCLLLCIEIFKSEMEYAMEHGSAVVIEELKKKGYYPYSDMDREPVF
jgi:hypothetical protein